MAGMRLNPSIPPDAELGVFSLLGLLANKDAYAKALADLVAVRDEAVATSEAANAKLAEIAVREAAVDERVKFLTPREEKAAARQASLDASEEAFATSIAARNQGAVVREDALSKREFDVDARTAALDAREAAVADHEAELAAREEAVTAREHAADARDAALKSLING